jgi:rfaE bifunctional protein nucleotidyltransferase chain/domain
VNLNQKIRPAGELSKISLDLKKKGKKIVFTNGCFDLLHPGHLHYLIDAKGMGDILIVGINSDDSIRKIKGEKRPLTPERDRLEMLAGLECVDFVTTFNEPDPYRLISLIKPDLLVKGGDWGVDQIIGKEIVEKEGGKVVSIPLSPGYSTTKLIEKIIARFSSKGKECEG